MRALVIFLRLAPFVLAFVWDRRRFLIVGGPRPPGEARHRRRAERLTRTVAELGPTFIKLAQVFAARADILPEPYLSAVGTLADQVPPLPGGVAEGGVRSELGDDVGRLFDRFEPVPLAAASLGQVHRASYQGRGVGVKVLRPGVDDLVRRDLDVSFRILFLLNLIFPNHHVRAITAIVSEFSRRIRDELDFREEARNAAPLRRNFSGEPRIVVPEVVPELVTRRVLVLEYVEGTRIDRLQDRLGSGELDLARLLETVVD